MKKYIYLHIFEYLFIQHVKSNGEGEVEGRGRGKEGKEIDKGNGKVKEKESGEKERDREGKGKRIGKVKRREGKEWEGKAISFPFPLLSYVIQ